MTLALGIKSDAVEYRYSYEWLFALMRDLGVVNLQLGSSAGFYLVDDDYFVDLRRAAERHDVRIRSCFTAHRELGGFFTGDARLERAARAMYERWIRVGALVGADSVGSNPGAVYRDRMDGKAAGVACYLRHLTELMGVARRVGLRALTIEPMSSLAEPPTTVDEILQMAEATSRHHAEHPDATVAAWFCGDISHGLVDAEGRVVHDHWELFRAALPWMWEFHFKNTDSRYHSTFGFGPSDRERGIVRLAELAAILAEESAAVRASELVGYLEIGGPKLGRDYSDPLLRGQIEESIAAIREAFPSI